MLLDMAASNVRRVTMLCWSLQAWLSLMLVHEQDCSQPVTGPAGREKAFSIRTYRS